MSFEQQQANRFLARPSQEPKGTRCEVGTHEVRVEQRLPTFSQTEARIERGVELVQCGKELGYCPELSIDSGSERKIGSHHDSTPNPYRR